jgi:PhnB protein
VVLQLRTADVETLVARMVAAGAEVVAPAQEFCGDRMARLRDPFGHLWILSEPVEALTVEEIRARRAAFFARLAAPPSERAR